MDGWERGRSRLADVVWEQNDTCLRVYKEDPSRVLQDANNELRISSGGYHDRQLEELVQNAVDAARRGGRRVEVVLTRQSLYVANDGDPFDEQGVRSVMASDISTKGDDRIGKFGIGFKSVLAVSDSPKVISRSVSFGFDREWSSATLRGEGFDAKAYPTMRLAKPLDPVAEAALDPHLRQLMEWASTVVVVPLSTSYVTLSKRLYDFPDEFVLFSPHVQVARLRNLAESADPRPKGARSAEREITVERDGDGLVRVRSGRESRTWSVVSAHHQPSSHAIADGGHVAAREQVEVTYAVPVPPGTGTGTFWAYFPTSDSTTLSGIANAPWKLSDDRTRLLAGRFNEEMLGTVLPRLVGMALASISADTSASAGDVAAAVLDVMPARGKESRGWADDFINRPVFEYLRSVPSLPDATGRLRVPEDLRWVGDVPTEWLDTWNASGFAPRDRWVHPVANRNAERRLKVSRLLGLVGETEGNSSIEEWLEALVEDGTVEASAAAIMLGARITQDMSRLTEAEGMTSRVRQKAGLDEAAPDRVRVRAQRGIASAKIVRLEDGSFRSPTKGRVFVRVEGDTRDDVDFVDPDLAAIPGVREALRVLGIVIMDRSGELRALLARAKQPEALRNAGSVWPKIWEVLRDIPMDAALRILREDLNPRLEHYVRVRTAAGTWITPASAFLGGSIVPVDGSRDRGHLIDPTFHRADVDLLREIGAVEAPVWRHGAPREPWIHEYEEAMRERFIERQKGSRPDPSKVLVEGSTVPWPMEILREMSEESRVAATRHIIARGRPEPWTVRHTSNTSYGTFKVIAPEMWFVRRNGLLATPFGNLPPRRVFHASPGIDSRIFPAVEASDEMAKALGLKTDLSTLSAEDWAWLKATADRWTRSDDDDVRRSDLYTWVAGELDPDQLVVRVGSTRQLVDRENVGVTADPSVYATMLDAHVPALLVTDPEDVGRLIELWGLRPATELLQEEVVSEPAGEAVYLTDAFPPLKLYLAPEDQDVLLQPCSRLVRMVATPQGQKAQPIPARREGDTVLVTGSTHEDRLAQVSRVLDLGLDRSSIAKIFDAMEKTAVDELRQKIRSAADDDDRLLTAAGVDALRRIVPAQALRALEERPDGVSPREVSALARAVHGVAILKQLRSALDERGLQPPKEWAGRRLTRDWVASLGFPADWAGFPASSRPAVEVIDGPAVLKPLHEYQVEVTERIAALLRGIGKDRGMVSLPTGAGKTRVTVEALVNGVRHGDISIDQPLVWIAQTDELCEQAAETWTYVWRAIGPQVPMRLGRLWASNEVGEEPGSFQLVVATIDKLHSIKTRGGSEYAWLTEPSVVVIDEAHTSIASSYTQVLEWMGRGTRGRDERVRKPLLGLTATPFKGTSESETERLVNRYDGNRLDRGSFRNADDPYGELQDMGVLARVRQKLIDGTDVELTDADVAEIERMRRLPSSVTDRLGEDLDRTRRIVHSIAQLPEHWTVLAFAPSVENARVLAALLSHEGIPAASVSADTDSAARRHYVEEFKAGRIRVITNYNVLTQGFDAPKVQAVYVTRPTFSPNVYQQMIGRGLRGPKNGGSREVLIVNVRDNFQKYGDLLAFNEFEYLWTRR